MKVVSPSDFSDEFKVGDNISLAPPKRKKYLLTPVTNVSFGDTYGGAESRSFIEIDQRTGMGIIHLDFISNVTTATSNQTTPIFKIPEECPSVSSIIENGLGTGSIFVIPNDSNVYVKRITNRTRHIVNLVGFFNVS